MGFKAFEGREKHLKAKERVRKLLEARGFYCEEEVPFRSFSTTVGCRSYTPDIVATLKLIVEIDGKDHGSKIHIHKDEIRDEAFKELEHAHTLRLKQDWIVGRKAISEQEVYDELHWQLTRSFTNA